MREASAAVTLGDCTNTQLCAQAGPIMGILVANGPCKSLLYIDQEIVRGELSPQPPRCLAQKAQEQPSQECGGVLRGGPTLWGCVCITY